MKTKKALHKNLRFKIVGLLLLWLGIGIIVLGCLVMNFNIPVILAGLGLVITGLFAIGSPEAWENAFMTIFGF